MMIKRLAATMMVVVFTLTLSFAPTSAQTLRGLNTDTRQSTDTTSIVQPSTPNFDAAPIPQPTAEQKAQLVQLAKAWEQRARDAESARDKYMLTLISVLAELGLKPSETSVTFDEKGEPVFERAKPKPTPAAQLNPPKKKN